MNKIQRVIFIASTISHHELSQYIQKGDLLLPEIKRQDLIITLQKYPSIKTIVIVDGVFEQQASITHKEILWVLSQGIQVIGMSSIGALRAYELRHHGMVGYGEVFNSYLHGQIDGDDEVAVSYFPDLIENNKTIAMVNIRKTFKSLNIDDENAINTLKKIHFKNRTWPSLEKQIAAALYMQLKTHYIDQKKLDVLSYLKLKTPLIAEHNSTPSKKIVQNMFFTNDLIFTAYHGTISFIREKLKCFKCPITNTNPLSIDLALKDLKKFMGLNQTEIVKVAFILNQLKYFKYKQKKILHVAEKIRCEQNLLSSKDFKNFLDSQRICKENISYIFENIAKLSIFFQSSLYSRPHQVG